MKLTQEQIDNPKNEKEVQAAVVKFLRDTGWLVIRNQQNIGSHKGIADLVCINDGRTIWVECKGPKGNMRDDQIKFRDSIKKYGGEYCVVKSMIEMDTYLMLTSPSQIVVTQEVAG